MLATLGSRARLSTQSGCVPLIGTPGTPVVGPSLRLLAASGWLSLRGSLPIRLLASCAQSTILDPMPAHPTRIASLHGDGRQWPQTHEGGPSSTPTCPGAVVWVQMQTQKGSGCWDNAEHPPTPSRPAVQASLNCRRWCWPAGPNLTLVIAPFCAWRPAEALRPWAAGFRIILLCPLNKHTQGLHPEVTAQKAQPARETEMASCKPHQPPASPEPLGWDEKKRREGSDRKSEKDPDSTPPPPKKKRTGNFTKPRSSPGCLFQSTTEGVTVNYQCASSTGQNVLGMVPRLAGLRNYSSASSSLPKAKVEE